MTTPGEKPSIDYDEFGYDEFDYDAPGCALCDAPLALVNTGGTYVLQPNHAEDCELMVSIQEGDKDDS